MQTIRKNTSVPLNETASRWENTSYSASLRRPCFALASPQQQSLAQTAPLARATNLHIKANRVPPPPASFKSLYPQGRNGLRWSHRLRKALRVQASSFCVPYKVRPTSIGSIAEVRSFRLRKADGTIHIVSETLEGCTCTCLDYVKVRSIKGSHCKHLLAAFAVGLLDGQKGGAK